MNEYTSHSSYINTDCQKKSYNIVLVEDSKTFSQKIADGLKKNGHQVTQLYTFTDAKKYIVSKQFDFILLDLILPDGDGTELLDEMNKETRSKVIVLSGDEDYQRRSYIFESGILDYFSKSNPTHKIIADIQKLLCTIQVNESINVLIVDDSAFMRKMLKNILEPKKFNIIEAKDGQEGLDILYDVDIHLIILDYEMPIMNGNDFIEKVKQNISFLDLPIVMLSGNDDKNIIARALKNGASDFLKKPFATEELLLKCDLHIKNYLNVKIIKQKDKELISSLEKTKEAEKHKAIFLANMSHEIRTPLNAIMGFVDLLRDDETNAIKLNYLDTIQQSGDLLLKLIGDILDFSKISNGKMDITSQVFSIQKLVDLIVSLFTPMMQQKNLVFTVNVARNVPKMINSDYLRIQQILINLLGNAIKFTDINGTIECNITPSQKENHVNFSIIDTGIGIAKENHQKIFELFSQAEANTTHKFGGTGLGLSICAELVSLLDGTIGVHSTLGKGSEFYFDIPIGDVEPKVTSNVKKASDTIELSFDKHVLLVEDNLTNQKFMQIIFAKFNLSFEIASNGRDAIKLYENNSYDMIFMDENMPDITGIETTQKIRALEKALNKRHTPIVAFTANALDDEQRFKNVGMDEYLTKPLDKEKFVELLVKYFDNEMIFDLVDDTHVKNSFDETFLEKIKSPLFFIEESIEKVDYETIIKFINIIKMISRKFKHHEVFALCVNIETSANEQDIQSCKNFMMVLKNQLDMDL